jgi:hypothetical protein
LTTPTLVSLSSGPLELGQPYALEWSGSGDGEVILFVSTYNLDTMTNAYVFCSVDDTGAFEIPASLTAELEPVVSGNVSVVRTLGTTIEPTVRIEGDYQVTEQAAQASPGWEGRFGFTRKSTKAHMQAASDFLASPKGCGAGVFPVGAEVDVGKDGCAGLGQRPIASCKQDFDLVFQEGDTLAFGERPADNDLCTKEKRPTKKAGLEMTRRR